MEAEEWYQYTNPGPEDNKKNVVLLSVDPKDVSSSKPSLPYVWVNDTEFPGRTWQTGLGHLQTILARDDVVEMIYRGVVWAGGGYDLAGCMKPGDPKYNAAATVPCANCCVGGVSVKNGTDVNAREAGFSVNMTSDFSVSIHVPGRHSVSIFDVEGRLVAKKEDGSAAKYRFPEISKPGIYFVKIATPKETVTRRVERF
jgi:hypothetical protein